MAVSRFIYYTPQLYLTSSCRKLPFQDVAKAGLKFGDEGKYHVHLKYIFYLNIMIDEDDEDKESAEELAERYKPLLEWLKERSSHVVRDGMSCPID